MCLIDRFEKAGIDIQMGLLPYKLNDKMDDGAGGAGDDDIAFQNLTVDKSVVGQFETVVVWGTVTSSPKMEPKIGMLKVGVEIAHPSIPSQTDK
jgi:hypothetical protein